MKRPVTAALALLLLSHAERAALADQLPALGTRLRVTTDHRLVGRLVAQDERTLTLQVKENEAPVVLPRTTVTRVEESLRPGRKGRGALIGAALGAGASAVLGVAAGDDCSGDQFLCYSASDVAAMSAVGLVPLGILIGALAAPGEQWGPVSSGQRVGVRLMPVRGRGIGAFISVRF